MDILDLIIYAFVLYAAFKLGEAFAYVKLTQGIQALKDQTKETIKKIEGVLTVEKINNQYYAYMNDDFVGQGSSLDEVQELVKNLIIKYPLRYSSLKVTLKD
jgi:ferritin-like metal-binding protein YciE